MDGALIGSGPPLSRSCDPRDRTHAALEPHAGGRLSAIKAAIGQGFQLVDEFKEASVAPGTIALRRERVGLIGRLTMLLMTAPPIRPCGRFHGPSK